MMKQAAQAWAFAAILLLPNYVDLTSSTGDARMRVPVPLTPVALAHITGIVIVAAFFFAAMAILRRLRAWSVLRWILLAALPILLLARNVQLFPFEVPNLAIQMLAAVWAIVLLLVIFRFPRFAERLHKFGSTFLAGFAIFALVMTVQLVGAALWRPGPQSFSNPIPVADPARPRLVWIIFDELAYQPVFETRDPSLQLPNFDRLRKESTLYSQVTPIASRTVKVIQGLQSGQVVTDFTFNTHNRFTVRNAGDPHFHDFDPNATLFGLAHQRGLTISVVGWYVAYCPTFSAVLSTCYWNNEDAQDRGPTALSATFAQNVFTPLRILVEQVFAPGHAWADFAAFNASTHALSVRDLRRHALAAVDSSQADILYLHLPAPHPPAVWDRHATRFAAGGSYLDSLDFTDRLLGQILERLQGQPRWASTTLIVEGDHSWRTWMWRSIPGWSAEDERISRGGQFDPRPVLFIHTPGQNAPRSIDSPTSLMTVHDTVAAMIDTIAQSRWQHP